MKKIIIIISLFLVMTSLSSCLTMLSVLMDDDETINAATTEKAENTQSIDDIGKTTTNKSEQNNETEPDKETAQSIPLGMQNAVKKAKSYLGYQSFSKEGLINQLEFEGFSNDEAVYAVNNCGADWNEQAADKAKSYLKYQAFSAEGLINQLEFEGFTHNEAEYAVNNCEADWNEQAAKKAKSYLSFSSFSRQGLIDQLEFEGFTHEQAEYGVNSVGF